MHCRDVYLADFLKTNLSKIAVIFVKWRQKAGFCGLISCKITILTREKERAVVFCRIKTDGHKKVHLAVTFSKIWLDIHFVIRNRACVALSIGLVNVKETFFNRISCKIVPETSSK